MTRRTVLFTAAALVSALAIPVGGAGAQTDNIIGLGNTTCTGAWSGKITFAPPWKNGGVATAEKATIKATAKPCASGVPVPTKGTVSGTEVITGAGANNCSLILPPPPATVTIAFPWLEKIKWHPSTIHFTQVAYPNATVTSTVTAAPVTFGATGPTVAGSSYVSAAATQSVNTVKTYAVITGGTAGNCGNASGLASLVISPIGTTGTF
jgi:hypothetical protein